MSTCVACGSNVTGKKFCPDCGTPVQPAIGSSSPQCPHCHADVKPGAAFCMHCGTALMSPTQANSATTYTPPPPPATRPCPACHVQVSAASAFCTSCGHDMNAVSGSYAANSSSAICANCGRQNTSGMHFCGGCGSPLVPANAAQYGQPQQYPQQSGQYGQPQQSGQYGQSQQYPQQSGQYSQSQQQAPYQQQYSQQPNSQYNQGGYPQQQQQPMFGQGPQVLRCPVCQAMAAVGTAYCVSCRTSLAGVIPTPANIVGQPQQGGFLQGNNGKIAMGVLGGAAAVLGGEMLFHGAENAIEDRVDGDMGYGRRRHHRQEGLLGGLEELGDDIGLF